MKKYFKKIFIFVLCVILVLVPFSNCFAIVAEATGAGLGWLIAESAGISISTSGFSSSSDVWIGFENDLLNPDGSMNFRYNNDGSISVDATTYNAVLDSFISNWGVEPTWTPSVINRDLSGVTAHNIFWHDWYNKPITVGYDAILNDNSVGRRWETDNGRYFQIYKTGSTFRVGYYYSNGDFISNTSSLGEGTYVAFGIFSNEPVVLYNIGSSYSYYQRFTGLGYVYPQESIMTGVFSVTPAEVDNDGIISIVEGAAAITSRKMHDVINKYVTLTPILSSGDKPLVGVEPTEINSILEQGFFDSSHEVVEISVSDGSISDNPDEEETNFLPWFMPLFEHLSETIDNIYTAISEFFANQGSGTPVFPDDPPDFLGGGDGGIRFHVSGIWHYVVSFVQSLGGAFSLFGSVWSGLPSAMFAAVYAAAVVVIVVGLFKRYIG